MYQSQDQPECSRRKPLSRTRTKTRDFPFRFLVGKQSFVPGTALTNHLGRRPLLVAEGENQETNNETAEYEGNYPEKVHGRNFTGSGRALSSCLDCSSFRR
ncbi:hypothetical protein GA0061093_111179 [Rhodococcus qingshengii]|nr:hypothetical protein GA0061093_111179 [Rhodococcus qingshengii]